MLINITQPFTVFMITLLLLFSPHSFASTDTEEDSFQSYNLNFTAKAVNATESDSSDYSITSYIVGGDDAEQDYPWMVALYQNSGFICGATLISSQWIVTAAHCVYEDDDNDGNATAYDASNYNIIIGESTHYSTITLAESAEAETYDIKSIIIHPSYDSDSYDYDIALIELDSPYYQPGPAISTSSRFDSIEEADLITTIGYGYTSGDATPEDIPSTLQEVDLPFISTNSCYWDDYGYITDNMFCAGYESTDINIDSCNGDSGGPLFMTIDGEQTLVGIVSWGASTCSDLPGVYTKISHLRSWILANIDGFQVVDEGQASYDSSETASFTPGLISVYHYGTDSDNYISIGDLSFDDEDYVEVLNLTDNCSNTYLYETDNQDASCNIAFDLTEAISDDLLFNATLKVSNISSEDESSDESSSDSSDDSSDESSDESSGESSDESSDDSSDESSSDSSGGSLGFMSLLSLALLTRFRQKLNKKSTSKT